nr:hypothetical protein CFOL_v3_24366 [Ipomoea batatas]
MFFTSSYTVDSDFDLTSFKIWFSTSGCLKTNQKNHVSAAEVVSRPASIKLITISITKFSSEWPELKNLDSSFFKCHCEFRLLERRQQVPGIVPESNLADIIKSESLKNILEIKNRFVLSSRGQNRNQPVGQLSLTVGIEDSVAEKITQIPPGIIPFGVNRKFLLEDMLHIQGIGSEHLTVTKRAVKGERQIGSALKHVGNPLKPAVLVLQHGEIRTH